jgi:nicotinate phosphoribosyltransferase
MGVSWDAPSLDSAYKLVAVGGRPVMKLSAGKVGPPGAKQVFRSWDQLQDVVAGQDEPAPAGFEPLLLPVMAGGRRTTPPEDVREAALRVRRDVARLPEQARALSDPTPLVADISRPLHRLTRELSARLAARELEG